METKQLLLSKARKMLTKPNTGYIKCAPDILVKTAESIRCKIEARHRPIVDDLRGKHDSIPGAVHLAAHVKLGLVALVAAERLEGRVCLEDGHEVLSLANADAVLEEIH